jgi:predicted SprT family Zn-dependent metalloprotease
MIKNIQYKGRNIKVLWEKQKGSLGIYDPNDLTLRIKPKMSKLMLGKILFHELWHIIVDLNKKKIKNIGEEACAMLTEQFAVILKKNPKLKRLMNNCLK